MVAARPTKDQMIGTNGFIDDPIDKLSAVSGTLREYHLWAWDAGDGAASYVPYPNNRMRWEPSDAAGGNGWFFDQYYRALAKRGVTVVPCLMESPRWLTPGSEDRPVAANADPTLPSSYAAHADYLFQFAARYGRRAVPLTSLRLGADQPKKSGLGLIQYVENWNEPNKNWRGKLAEFSPDQFAAMCSADYDGDQGRMGPGFGVKSADPTMKLVMGGLVGVNIPFIEGLRQWSVAHRGGSLPFDVINVQTYCNDAKNGEGLGTVGVSPEASDLHSRLSDLVQWRDHHAPKCEVWLSEFGYDVNPQSIQRAPAIGTRSAEWTQAAWISRTYLIAAAAGVDRAMQYMFRDHNVNDRTQYASSGLVTTKGEWRPRLSFTATETLRRQLSGFRPVGKIQHPLPEICVLKFKGASTHSPAAMVVWANTSRDASIVLSRRSLPRFTQSTRLDNSTVAITEDTLTVTEMPTVLR
jgi:hypothetical protein